MSVAKASVRGEYVSSGRRMVRNNKHRSLQRSTSSLLPQPSTRNETESRRDCITSAGMGSTHGTRQVDHEKVSECNAVLVASGSRGLCCLPKLQRMRALSNHSDSGLLQRNAQLRVRFYETVTVQHLRNCPYERDARRGYFNIRRARMELRIENLNRLLEPIFRRHLILFVYFRYRFLCE
jgi:hypothetical protein